MKFSSIPNKTSKAIPSFNQAWSEASADVAGGTGQEYTGWRIGFHNCRMIVGAYLWKKSGDFSESADQDSDCVVRRFEF